MKTTPMRRIVPVFAALLIFPPAMVEGQQDSRVTEGARIYGDVCGRCHNPRSPLERSDNEWVIVIHHMRVRGNLTGSQARSVLAFLQATNVIPTVAEAGPPVVIEGRGPPSTDQGTIERGRQLVAERACIGCHMIRGTGGAVGPGLDGVVRRRGADFVRQKLANPLFNNMTSMMPNFAMSASDIEALVAYLATLQP